MNMEESEKRLGLGFRTCHYFWGKEGEETLGHDGTGIWFKDLVSEFEILDLDEPRRKNGEDGLPQGVIMRMRYKSICFDPSRHLAFLFEKVQQLGARIIKVKVDSSRGPGGVVQDAKRILAENGEDEQLFALINCAGLSARHFLPPEEAEKLFPIRGQTILIKGEAKMTQTFVGIPGKPDSEMLYVVPRPGSATTILGGCKQVGNWDEEVDEALSARIIEGVKKERLCEDLRDENGDFEVLSYQVGFRPGRKGGPRVEVEKDVDGKVKLVDGTRVVHSYGHAGAGYQGSVGCAEAVVELVQGLCSSV